MSQLFRWKAVRRPHPQTFGQFTKQTASYCTLWVTTQGRVNIPEHHWKMGKQSKHEQTNRILRTVLHSILVLLEVSKWFKLFKWSCGISNIMKSCGWNPRVHSYGFMAGSFLQSKWRIEWMSSSYWAWQKTGLRPMTSFWISCPIFATRGCTTCLIQNFWHLPISQIYEPFCNTPPIFLKRLANHYQEQTLTGQSLPVVSQRFQP